MSDEDLKIFSQAIQQATTNPLEAYQLLQLIEPRNPQDTNLLSWLIFTAPDYAQKEYWATRARTTVPNAPGVQQALNWFATQPKPNSTLHQTYPTTSAIQTTPTSVVSEKQTLPADWEFTPADEFYSLSKRQVNLYRFLLFASVFTFASVFLPWVGSGSARPTLNALDLFDVKNKYREFRISGNVFLNIFAGYSLLLGSILIAGLAIISLVKSAKTKKERVQLDKTLTGLILLVVSILSVLLFYEFFKMLDLLGHPTFTRILTTVVGEGAPNAAFAYGFVFAVICLIALFIITIRLVIEHFNL